MKIIHQINSDKLKKNLKRGEIKLAHYPNGVFCWAAKNLIGEIRYFGFNGLNAYPTKVCEKFSQGKSYLY